VVGTLKQKTSRKFQAQDKFLAKVYWDRGGIWSKGYLVATVGINEDIIRRYVAIEAGQAQLEF
jgi:putative transposase